MVKTQNNYNRLLNEIEMWFDELFPIHRSLTGEGNRKTLSYIKNIIPELEIKSVPSGTKVFDWKVPEEWKFHRALLRNAKGKVLIDSNDSNINVLQYSKGFHGRVSKSELLEHLHTLPSMPSAVPYRTSYYSQTWGLCCRHDLLSSIDFIEPFDVSIDASFEPQGILNWGEVKFPGTSNKEIIISTYICHPSLANDNLSGIISAMLLSQHLKELKKPRYTYRIIFCPETIGTLVFLSQHKNIDSIVGGAVLSNTGGPGNYTLKQSFSSEHEVNRALVMAAKIVLGSNFELIDFTPDGSDERQFSKPAFRINTPSMHKSKYYDFAEYHTDQDNKSIIDFDGIITVNRVYQSWINILERNYYPRFIESRGELHLGKRGLYPKIGGVLNQSNKVSIETSSIEKDLEIISWMMHYFDGRMSILQLSEKLEIDFEYISNLLGKLEKEGCVQ